MRVNGKNNGLQLVDGGHKDVGKTNFLYALRYVFDKDIRKLNFSDSDFHNKQIEKPIETVVTLDIRDTGNSDCQKLRAQLKGALQRKHDKVNMSKAHY